MKPMHMSKNVFFCLASPPMINDNNDTTTTTTNYNNNNNNTGNLSSVYPVAQSAEQY